MYFISQAGCKWRFLNSGLVVKRNCIKIIFDEHITQSKNLEVIIRRALHYDAKLAASLQPQGADS